MRLWCCRAVFLPKALDKLLGYKKQLLNQHMTAFARKLKKGHGWICQQDNDPKHTSRKKKNSEYNTEYSLKASTPCLCVHQHFYIILKKTQSCYLKRGCTKYCQQFYDNFCLFVCFMIIFQLFYFKGQIFLWIFWNNLKQQEDKHQRHFSMAWFAHILAVK